MFLKLLHAKKMKSFHSVSVLSDTKNRSFLTLVVVASLICCAYFSGSVFFAKDYKIFIGSRINCTQQNMQPYKCKTSPGVEKGASVTREITSSNKCTDKCRPQGSEALPSGIVSETSDLEMRSLWGPVTKDNKMRRSVNLLAIAVGIKQKEIVNQIVQKFLENDFVVMLFHYDGIVDGWNHLDWSSRVIHISATNQTKWWFAKRFLHPDIVAEYDYVFLWDEDLGVENFHPGRYLSIVKEEGLEISQPALDPAKSEIHHQITARMRKSRVHRRIYKFKGGGRCYENSTSPPCVGWVEMMAPVFSRAAWRCAWYMIQNDLIHAWGLDMQLGYCAQGDRARKVGVVDSEYVVHMGLPTLGGTSSDEQKLIAELPDHPPQTKNSEDPEVLQATSSLNKFDNRFSVRQRSYMEMRIFKRRWNAAVKQDECWVDPFKNGSSSAQIVQ